MGLGKIVWMMSFVLVLCSMLMLIPDLIGIQRSVQISSGAGYWYDGELSADLLRLQVAVRDLQPDSPPEVIEGLRAQYHPDYYGAFVIDPDGNNIEAVYHGPAERSADSVRVSFAD